MSQSQLRVRERGITLWIVIPLILIDIAIMSAIVVIWSEKQSQESKRSYLKERIKNLEIKNKELSNKICEAVQPYVEFTGDPTELPTREAQQYYEEKAKLYRELDSKVDKSIWFLQTLQDLVPIVAQRVNFAQMEARKVEQQRRIASDRVSSARGICDEIKENVRKEIENYKKQLEAVNEQIKEENEDFSSRKKVFEQQLDSVRSTIKKEEADHLATKGEKEGEIKKIESKIATVLLREWFSAPIFFTLGKITTVDVVNKVAFIDIGSDDRVVPGLLFFVGKKGGVTYSTENGYTYMPYTYKAVVEVQTVWKKSSRVVITKIFDPAHPVVEGDLLINPLFHTKRPIVVGFLGRQKVRGVKLSLDEASRRIREIGSVVKKLKEPTQGGVYVGEIDVDTDILILYYANDSFENEECYKIAKDLGIPVVKAQDIIPFLGE